MRKILLAMCLLGTAASCTKSPNVNAPPVAVQAPAAVPATVPAAVAEKVTEKNGLRLSMVMDQDKIVVGEPLKFALRIKNVSNKAMKLLDADHVDRWEMLFARDGETTWHSFRMDVAGEIPSSSLVLEPGQLLEVPCSLENLEGQGFGFLMSHGKQREVKPGKYRLAVQLDLQVNENDKEPAVPYWVGKIKTEPVEFRFVEKPGTT